MKVGSLFSGIGGLEYGLERSGLVDQTSWMVEMDPYCCQVLRKNYPNAQILEQKIEEIDPETLPKVDIITAGFPCQPVSTAGKRKGVNDERWLWDEVWRFLDVLRPRYFILENVPGLLTANKGKAFERVIQDIAQSRLYNFEWAIVSARSVGAPHLRKRFFGVGSLADTIDSGQRTHEFGTEREGQENSEERRGRQVIEPGRQSSSDELGNSEHNGSSSTENRRGIGECSIQGGQGEEVQKIIDRESEGESKISRQEAELWMGDSSYGFPRWMARLGMKNVWSKDPNTWRTPTTMDKSNALKSASKIIQGKNTRPSGQPVQVSLAVEVAMEQIKDNPDLLEEYDEKIVNRPNLPPQKEFVDYLRSVTSAKDIKNRFKDTIPGSKIDHWFRYDNSGFSYPTIEHWNMIKPYLIPLQFDEEMTTIVEEDWHNDLEFPTASARDHKDTYGTVLTGSKTGDRKTLPLEIFRNMRDQVKDFAAWEFGMPRTLEEYPDRVARLKALGNAVVPECAELVGRLLKRSIEEDTVVFDNELLR